MGKRKANKYTYLWVVQGYYSMGWEDVCASEVRSEARTHLREYRENCPEYAHRLIHRRERNEQSEVSHG